MRRDQFAAALGILGSVVPSGVVSDSCKQVQVTSSYSLG